MVIQCERWIPTLGVTEQLQVCNRGLRILNGRPIAVPCVSRPVCPVLSLLGVPVCEDVSDAFEVVPFAIEVRVVLEFDLLSLDRKSVV